MDIWIFSEDLDIYRYIYIFIYLKNRKHIYIYIYTTYIYVNILDSLWLAEIQHHRVSMRNQ